MIETDLLGKLAVIFVWLAVLVIISVFFAGVGLSYAQQHVQHGKHSFDHSTAGIMVISAGCALAWAILCALVTSLMISAWDEIF